MKDIEFVKEFSSPVFGYVYHGKKVSVKGDVAAKMIESGRAKEVVEKKPAEETKSPKRQTYKKKK